MKKIFAIITLLLTALLLPAIGVAPSTKAEASVTDTTVTLTSSADGNNKVAALEYKNYPVSVLYTNAGGALTTDYIRALRTDVTPCVASPTRTSQNAYKVLPWQGVKVGKVDNTVADNMAATSGNCSDRYNNGGVAPSTGGWISPMAYGGWALRGVKNGADGSGLAWGQSVLTGGNTTGHFTDSPKIWATNFLPTNDQAVDLYRKSGESPSYTNITNEKLLSSGVNFFRNEFTLSDDQINRLINLSYDVKADEFVKVYLNGVPLGVQSQSPAYYADYNTTGSVHRPNGTISKATLLNTYSVRSGNNVLAFQVNDKAAWADLNGASTSNAVGLWYRAVFNLNPTVLGCTDPNATNYNPSATTTNNSCTYPVPTCVLSATPVNGSAPLTIQATIISSNMPNGTTYNYTMGEGTVLSGRGTSIYFTYGTAGEYTISATASNLTPCGTGVRVKVIAPTNYNGGEVSP